jgi:hypothetical protein
LTRDIILDHKDISDAQTMTPVVDKAFKKAGLDLHRHEVEHIDDDFKKGKRRLRVKATQYFTTGLSSEAYDRIFGKK